MSVKKLSQGVTQLSNDITNVLRNIANDMERDAKKLAPIGSGRLRDSISTKEQDSRDRIATKSYRIGSELDYAIYVEENKPFLEPVANNLEIYLNKNRKR